MMETMNGNAMAVYLVPMDRMMIWTRAEVKAGVCQIEDLPISGGQTNRTVPGYQ